MTAHAYGCAVINKPKVKHDRARLRLRGNKRKGAIQNVCLVTRQSFNEGSLDTRAWKRSVSRALTLWKLSIEGKPVGKREFNNPMDKIICRESSKGR